MLNNKAVDEKFAVSVTIKPRLSAPLEFVETQNAYIELESFTSSFSKCGEIVSKLYEFSEKPPTFFSYLFPPLFSYSADGWTLLEQFLCSNIRESLSDEVDGYSLEHARNFTILNKGEFEGALISNLLSGGGSASPCTNRTEARKFASQLIDSIFPDQKEYADFIVYRFNDHWTGLQECMSASSWSYIVYDYNQQLCWLIIFGSKT